MKATFNISNLKVVIDSDRIVFDAEMAHFYRIDDDDEYTFDVITCAARPVEFSIVNQLSHLDRDVVVQACAECNETKELYLLSTNNYHMILSPFVERYTFFGEEQAKDLTLGVVDICNNLGAKSLRITQFCMMRSEMPFFPQFKGILNALLERPDSSLDLVYFDVPEKYFYELNILFKTYEDPSLVN